MNTFDYPSPTQLYALEQRARRERAEAMGRLIAAAASSVKSFIVRAFASGGPGASDVHKQVARHA